jgi:uncharacterized membrane protein
MSEIEQVFKDAALDLKLFAEISSVTIIGLGIAVAIYLVFRALLSKERIIRYLKLRLSLGRFLVIALEFQLAADIIGTAVAPSWEQISKLAAIALIRTFLSYFLDREIKTEEQEEKEQEKGSVIVP